MHKMIPKRFAQVESATTAPAREVIEHFYNALLNLPPFTLKDGTEVRVEKYAPPEMNAQGGAQCGVDVKLPDGSHLEFTMRNTGWGKSFADTIAKRRARGGRQR